MNHVSISAYGFLLSALSSDVPTYLYGNKGTVEDGLGIASDPSHEINKTSYIQLDLSNIINIVKKDTIPSITIKHIQKDEGFAVFGSDKLGSLGTNLYTSTDIPEVQTVEIPSFPTYRYISITAAGSNITSKVLLNSINYVVCQENLPNS